MKLTQTVQKGGCAAKVAATELRKILQQVRFPQNDECVLIDGGLFDDAAVYKISEELALVQTLDFFTPIVDNPRTFGKIAAANAVSDVYAMGGVPKTALGILAFPLSTMPGEIVTEVLNGACEVLSEGKINFVGGHSIDDDSLKFGLSVTGFVSPQKIWSNQGAQPGDRLILTKPLGTGTATAGLKRQELTEAEIGEEVSSMCLLNRVEDLIDTSRINAATDITGFGFAGHLLNMIKASRVRVQITSSQLPSFSRTRSFLEKGFLTKAHRTNREYAESFIDVNSLPVVDQQLLFDPQTSGGLLLSVPAECSSEIVAALKNRFPKTKIVGQVVGKTNSPFAEFQ